MAVPPHRWRAHKQSWRNRASAKASSRGARGSPRIKASPAGPAGKAASAKHLQRTRLPIAVAKTLRERAGRGTRRPNAPRARVKRQASEPHLRRLQGSVSTCAPSTLPAGGRAAHGAKLATSRFHCAHFSSSMKITALRRGINKE